MGESAAVTFNYQIEDLFGETDTATVTITINGVNDNPAVANSGSAAVNEGLIASLPKTPRKLAATR